MFDFSDDNKLKEFSCPNPIKGINRAGSPRTGTILFTSNYLNALNSGIGSIISHGGIQNDETVVEYNCN